MPAASNVRTVRIALTALPKPVSQSAMTGMLTASFISRDASSISVIVRMLASGTPWLALIAKPPAHTPSKPASSTSRALSASCAPAITIADGEANNRRSEALFESVIEGGTITRRSKSRMPRPRRPGHP